MGTHPLAASQPFGCGRVRGYLVLAGALRFLIEFIRVNARVLGPLTIAHLFSGAMVIGGLSLIAFKPKEGQMKKGLAGVFVVAAVVFAYSGSAAAQQTWTGQTCRC